MLTLAGGGWVLVLAGVICLILITWAVAPAILRAINRPPGDGKNIESYGFFLSHLTVPRELISPATLHRDMVPMMSNPTASGPDPDSEDADRWKAMQKRNDPKYGKYVVSGDLVIGVTINGESRAYPLHVMYVHEIINDELGGVPIAVTYNWLCDSTVVFDRRIHRDHKPPVVGEFAVSGLVYNSNLLMYAKNEWRPRTMNGEQAGESLWCQLTGRAICGVAALYDETLEFIPYELARWDDWIAQHPATTIIDRDLSMAARYKKAAPTDYLNSSEIVFPIGTQPPADGPPAKSHVVAVSAGDSRRVYPMRFLIERAAAAENPSASTWTDTLGDTTVRFTFSKNRQTVRVEPDPPVDELRVTQVFWFAWHAMYPDDPLASGDQETPTP
jgi:hypothetical protein